MGFAELEIEVESLIEKVYALAEKNGFDGEIEFVDDASFEK